MIVQNVLCCKLSTSLLNIERQNVLGLLPYIFVFLIPMNCLAYYGLQLSHISNQRQLELHSYQDMEYGLEDDN